MTAAPLTKRFALAVLILYSFALAAASQKKLSATEAKDHFGETATVCGDVVSAQYAATTSGQPTFLNFDKPYPHQIFTIVIWGNSRSKFGKPEEEYRGKRICVLGKITAYAGLPEIVATDPKQIKLDLP